MRFLFVVPPLAGHTNPAVGVAEELRAQGHAVEWVAHADFVGHLLPAGSVVHPAGTAFIEHLATVSGEREKLRGVSALKYLWEHYLLPMAADMVPHVEAAVDAFAPDVIVGDQQALAAGFVAMRRGLPWATSATTSAEFSDAFEFLPTVAEWVRRHLVDLEREVGLPEALVGTFDPLFSPQLTIAYTTEALTGPIHSPHPIELVGPVLSGRRDGGDFPWAWLARWPRTILVSIGTVSHDIGGRFLRAAVEGVAGEPYGVVVVAPDGLIAEVPDNVLVRPFVPQVALLPELSGVVCHAGHNTVCEALAHRLPLVVAPIRDDQPIVASQAVAAGAAVRLSFPRASSADVRQAVREILDEPAYRTAAARIADSFAGAGGAPLAARRLVGIAEGEGTGAEPRGPDRAAATATG